VVVSEPRHKGKIVRIGTVVDEPGLAPLLDGWSFDGENKAQAVDYVDGEFFLNGYSIEELRQISKEAQQITEAEVAEAESLYTGVSPVCLFLRRLCAAWREQRKEIERLKKEIEDRDNTAWEKSE
jgi:hypothetical protein